jgi:hypothetical protein
MNRPFRRVAVGVTLLPALGVVVLALLPANERGFIGRFEIFGEQWVVERFYGWLIIRPDVHRWIYIWFSTMLELTVVVPLLLLVAFSPIGRSDRFAQRLTILCAAWLVLSGGLVTVWRDELGVVFWPPFQIAACILVVKWARPAIRVWRGVLAKARRALASISSRRSRAGLCASCRYDIRATAEAGGPLLRRCPECGTDVAPSAVASATPENHVGEANIRHRSV